jgi:MFS family permease
MPDASDDTLPRARVALTADGRLLFAARALRSFAFGWLSVVLALYLAGRGLGATEIGAVFTATMVEDALFTMLLSTFAARVGPARLMAATAPLIALGGVLLATARSPWLLVTGAVLGTLSPNGQDAGPFAPLEHSLLPGATRSGAMVRVFALYNLVAFAAAASGAALAGLVLGWSGRQGIPELSAERAMLAAYAGAGFVLTALYLALAARQAKAKADVVPPPATGRLGLGRSRGVVLQLAALQGLDALAGGFVMQSLIVYWMKLRFDASPEALGALFFGTNLLSALSFLAATRVAERFGLLNTMVFTHLPSNVLLLLVPFMPSFGSAACMLLARHLLSQMDVPTRQAYSMALVAPEERAAAAGFTVSVRALAQAMAPLFSGATMAAAATPLPFVLAGGLKIVYDLLLYVRFRSVPLPGSNAGARAGARGAAVLVAALLAAGSARADDEASRRLVAAAARGDGAGVAALARSGADPNARDAGGRPALVLAVAAGGANAVAALLRAGADPDRGDAGGWTALHQAALAGDAASAERLVEAGAALDRRARWRGTPLDVAETQGQPVLARLLRARGARGSGKSIGDTVCVRPWAGEGYCAVVADRSATRFVLRVSRVVGCARGCAADAVCSAGRSVGAAGLAEGDTLSVPASCVTQTGVR